MIEMTAQPIILFDGICNLCNKSVQYIIKHDPDGFFKFTTLQSETGQILMRKYGFTSSDLSSFVLIQDHKVFTRSKAALLVAKKLKGFIKLLYGFIIVPQFIRDGVYNIIAKNRYKWFGRKDSCMIPTPALQDRFLN